MASITSMMNSSYNTSSIYGNRNILSGLASGMDTESMIENAVSGIKTKIQNLLQRRTRVEWQQEAFRSIIDKAVNFNTKYTSYSSKTNLLSSSFFTNSVNTAVKGTYADKITASGKTSSNIKINAVKQMATAASYTVAGAGTPFSGGGAITGGEFDLLSDLDVSNMSGSLTFQYGGSNGSSFTISFDELENLNDVEVFNDNGTVKQDATNAEKLAQAINNKLDQISYSYTKNGYQEETTAGKAIKARVDSAGNITFSDGLGNGNNVTISSATGRIKSEFGLYDGDAKSLEKANRALTTTTSTYNYLAGKTLSVTFNGTTKNFSVSSLLSNSGASNIGFAKALQRGLDETFGEGKIRVGRGSDNNLVFETDSGNTLSLDGTAINAMGFEKGDSNYVNSTKKLGDLLGWSESDWNQYRIKGNGTPTEKIDGSGSTYYVDKSGNYVDKDGYLVDKTGKNLYNFTINGTSIKITEDTTLESLMNSINSNANMGVKVSYSKLTNEFQFTANETGANSKIKFGGLAEAIFSPSSSVSSSDSFADAYGIDMSSKTLSFRDPSSSWKTIDFNITGDMTEEDVLNGLKDLFKEKGLDYTAQYDDAGQISITDGNGESVSSWMAKNVNFYDATGNIYSFDITGKTMEDVVAELNEGAFQPGVSDYAASFDEETGKLIAVHRETGETFDIRVTDIGKNGETVEHTIQSKSTYTAGQDAILDVEINGVRFESLTRSGNSFDIDGMTINVKGTFGEYDENGNLVTVDKDGKDIESITFETTTDTEKIIDVIRDFVNDYNEMVTEIKNAYSTLPLTDSKNNRYEPLSAEEEASYTESALAAYNEKAKTGILFGDTTLSSMYGKLLNAITPGGSDGQTLREIGIGTSYSSGLTTLSLDEDKLRAALESNPDKVKDAFAKTVEGGSSANGLMQNLQNTLNAYVKTTGEPKGSLIVKAGSIKAPTSLNSNSLQSQINNYDKQIERWQNKMADQIDRYTTQFSRLEQLIAQMNSQASAFAGLMGGDSGYGY